MSKLFVLCVLLSIASCSEKDVAAPPPPTHPNMKYTDLQGREVKHGKSQAIDVDGNGTIDFAFYVIYLGDPVFQQDKVRFLAGSNIACNLLVDDNNNSPIFGTGETIKLGNTPPYEWFEISEVFLGEKIITDNLPPFWQGPWKDVSHKFIATQVVKNGQRFNGWIEISFDTTAEKLVLHRSAVSIDAEKEVKAGN